MKKCFPHPKGGSALKQGLSLKKHPSLEMLRNNPEVFEQYKRALVAACCEHEVGLQTPELPSHKGPSVSMTPHDTGSKGGEGASWSIPELQNCRKLQLQRRTWEAGQKQSRGQVSRASAMQHRQESSSNICSAVSRQLKAPVQACRRWQSTSAPQHQAVVSEKQVCQAWGRTLPQ